MYNIANKHNKKTRKLSSSSRNKHKSSSKSKNKRKHKYTIGNTRKRTKSYYTLQGGAGRRPAPNNDKGATLKDVARRLKQRQQDRAAAKAAAAPLEVLSIKLKQQQQDRAAAEAAAAHSTDQGIERWPTPRKTTEETPLNPPESHDTATVKAAANQSADIITTPPAPAAVDAAPDAKKAAEAKKAAREAREATKQQEKEKLLEESKQMYEKFIGTIDQYDFDTFPEEPSYIKFSKFIQVIMDLQFNIKDDQTRKKAQTITDQILNAYSAFVSVYCSNKFLKKHFEDYMDKLATQNKIKNKIVIKELKQPTVNIDDTVSSITPKLLNLANAQDCTPPTSQHIVPETPTDRSDFAFRLPSFRLPFRLPSFRRSTPASNSTNTSTAHDDETSHTLPPPRTEMQLMEMQGNPQQVEPPQGRQRSLTGKIASFLTPTTRTSALKNQPITTTPSAPASRATPTVYNRDDTFGYSATPSAKASAKASAFYNPDDEGLG
jgi:hypothetical protein